MPEKQSNRDFELSSIKSYLSSLIIFIVLGVSGCAGNPFIVPVNNPEQRISYYHFSFLPPKGNNWKTTEKPHKSILFESPMITINFVKHPLPTTVSKGETAAATAQVHAFHRDDNINKEMLLKYSKHSLETPPDDPRYKMIDAQYSVDDSYDTPCLRHKAIAEDKMVPGHSGSIFIFHVWGLTCVHPKYKNEIYILSASQRYLKGESPINLEKEYEPFLNSLQFN